MNKEERIIKAILIIEDRINEIESRFNIEEDNEHWEFWFEFKKDFAKSEDGE